MGPSLSQDRGRGRSSNKTEQKEDKQADTIIATGTGVQVVSKATVDPAQYRPQVQDFMPSSSSSSGSDGDDELSRIEVLDKIANGGMSQLELQQKLMTDVFMDDETRQEYLLAAHSYGPDDLTPDLQDTGIAQGSFETLQAQHAPILPPEMSFQDPLGPALGPQGLMSPIKGELMMSFGMIDGPVPGLLRMRSDRATPLLKDNSSDFFKPTNFGGKQGAGGSGIGSGWGNGSESWQTKKKSESPIDKMV